MREGTIGCRSRSWGLYIVISSWMVPAMVARVGERRTLYIGQFFGALGMVLAGLARTGAFFFLSIPIMMLWTISSPAAQGMMSRRVSESEQGELQGAIGSLASLAFIFGPGLFTFIFAFFIDRKYGWNIPGAPWYLGAVLLFVAMIMATRSRGSGSARRDGAMTFAFAGMRTVRSFGSAAEKLLQKSSLVRPAYHSSPVWPRNAPSLSCSSFASPSSRGRMSIRASVKYNYGNGSFFRAIVASLL